LQLRTETGNRLLPAVIAAKNFMIPSEEAKDTGGILGEVPENCICRWLAPEGAALNRKTADGNGSLQQEMAANLEEGGVESVPAPGARITKCTLRGCPHGGKDTDTKREGGDTKGHFTLEMRSKLCGQRRTRIRMRMRIWRTCCEFFGEVSSACQIT